MPRARTQWINSKQYVYIETSHRVAGRSYPDHKRTYIGKMVGDVFVPNAKFLALTDEEKVATALVWEAAAFPEKKKPGRPVASVGSRKFRGLDLLLSTIGRTLGLEQDLREVFTERTSMLLSVAYYLIANPDAAMYRFQSWGRIRFHPYGQDIESPRSSEFFGSITEDEIQRFLRLRVNRSCGASGWLAVDSTSISSYSKILMLVTKGHNKEHEILDQMNLLMVFDQDHDVPVFYRKLRGNIGDVSTVESTLLDLKGIGIPDASLVLDRGFYSKDNVIQLMKKHVSFTMGTKTSFLFVKEAIKDARGKMMVPSSYDEEREVFHALLPISFDIPVRGRDPDIRNAFLHLYCSKEKESDDVVALMKRIRILRAQLESGTPSASRKELGTYFKLETDDNGKIIGFSEDQEAISEAMGRCGFFALLTSDGNLNSSEVLSVYRHKDRVEKSFNNLKDRLWLRRTRCSKDENLNGKVFVQFVALILLSYIQKVMKEHALYKRYTCRELLDEFDVIEYFQYPNQAGHWGEVTEKQGKILETFGVDLPLVAWPKSIQKRKESERKANETMRLKQQKEEQKTASQRQQ